MAIRGVIFDLFHTLTARESEWSSLPWTSDMLGIARDRWDEVLLTRSRWRLIGEERDPYAILRALATEVDPGISDEKVRAALDVRLHRFRQSLVNVPGENLDTLRRLRAAGLRLGLLSNADAMEIAEWHASPLAGMFDVEIFSCEVGCVKPERAIYERCLNALDLPASECLFVGDGGSNELVGAREVGLSPVFVSGVIAELWPERVQARLALCDHHVERLPELLTILGLEGT